MQHTAFSYKLRMLSMSQIQRVCKWLLLLFTVLVLSACGGGSESSSLLNNNGSNTNNGNTPTTPTTPSTAFLLLEGQRILLPGQTSTQLTVTTYSSQDGTGIIGNVPFTFEVTGSATLEGVPSSTDATGQASFTVHDNTAETVLLTLTGAGNYTGSATYSIYFGGSVTADIVTKGVVAANGQDGAELAILARDSLGVAIENAPVTLSFPSNSFAVPETATGVTSASGEFRTKITNTVAQNTFVTPIVAGLTLQSLPLSFGTTTVSTITKSISLLKVRDSIASNGVDTASVIVVARDEAGTPISNVPISISSNSATAVMKVGDTEKTLFITGITGGDGSFELLVRNSAEETVTLNAVTSDSSSSANTSITETTDITFLSQQSTSSVSRIELDAPIGNGQFANGTDSVSLRGRVFDSANQPMAGITVSLLVSGGSAQIKMDSDKTDSSGRFFATLTDTVVEQFTARAVVGSVSSNSVTVEFKASTSGGVNVNRLSLVASPVIQNVGSKTLLNVRAFDSSNTLLAGVPITISATGTTAGTAVFNAIQVDTGTNGIASFEVENNVAGQFTIIASAQGSAGTLTDSRDVEFVAAGSDVADLTVTVSNNNQAASGETPITVNVIARDTGGRPVEGAPIVLQLSTGQAAVASPSRGITDANGSLVSQVTSSVAGDVAVTVAVEGTNIVHAPVILSFAAANATKPTRVDVNVLNNSQPADGTSKITLVVTPRDAQGSPITGVEVSFISDSTNVTLAGGPTNALGEFRASFTSNSTETFGITAVADGVTSEKVDVIFIPKDIPIPNTLTLNFDKSAVSVNEIVTLTVVARDQNGSPMQDVPIILSTLTGDTTPDISSSAIFGEKGFKANTNSSGVFSTTITSLKEGGLKVRASVEGGGLNSNEVSLTFQAADDQKVVTKMELFSSSTELVSEGRPEGVIITARLKDVNNNLVSGAKVNFSTDSGDIQAVTRSVIDNQESYTADAASGVTDISGQAYARLTTVGNANNRTVITSATSQNLTNTIPIEVVGTKITLSGTNAVILNNTLTLDLSLKDSANRGLANQTLTLNSSLGNSLSSSSIVTNSAGQASVVVTANNAGTDTITASKVGADSGMFVINISNDNFTINTSPTAGVTEIPLNTSQGFIVHWDKAGVPQLNEQLNVATTRGNLSTTSILTNTSGEGIFTLQSTNAGPAIVTVSSAVNGGPSRDINVEFIATNAAKMEVQAASPVIKVNQAGNSTEQSEVIAIVRDAENNLVKNKLVNFTVNDITGGRLTQNSAITDSFGQARTVYIAGSTSSASNGVKVTAMVADTPSVQSSVSLTVAQESAFISVGSGNALVDEGGIRYSLFHTVLVTDSNGTPVSNATVNLTVHPLTYTKMGGFNDEGSIISGETCTNEDINFNGILEAGEDFNNNARLDPGNVITVDKLVLTTNDAGFADFNVKYAKQFAIWTTVKIIARTNVAGTEAEASVNFSAACSAEDALKNICPIMSPFGTGSCSTPF